MCCSSRINKFILSFIVYFMDDSDGFYCMRRNYDGDIFIKILSKE